MDLTKVGSGLCGGLANFVRAGRAFKGAQVAGKSSKRAHAGTYVQYYGDWMALHAWTWARWF